MDDPDPFDPDWTESNPYYIVAPLPWQDPALSMFSPLSVFGQSTSPYTKITMQNPKCMNDGPSGVLTIPHIGQAIPPNTIRPIPLEPSPSLLNPPPYIIPQPNIPPPFIPPTLCHPIQPPDPPTPKPPNIRWGPNKVRMYTPHPNPVQPPKATTPAAPPLTRALAGCQHSCPAP
jgi:hypothetical protein